MVVGCLFAGVAVVGFAGDVGYYAVTALFFFFLHYGCMMGIHPYAELLIAAHYFRLIYNK